MAEGPLGSTVSVLTRTRPWIWSAFQTKRQPRPRDKERGTTSANFVLKFTIKYRDERMYKGSERLRAVVGKFNRHGMKSRCVTLLGVSQEDAQFYILHRNCVCQIVETLILRLKPRNWFLPLSNLFFFLSVSFWWLISTMLTGSETQHY